MMTIGFCDTSTVCIYRVTTFLQLFIPYPVVLYILCFMKTGVIGDADGSRDVRLEKLLTSWNFATPEESQVHCRPFEIVDF